MLRSLFLAATVAVGTAGPLSFPPSASAAQTVVAVRATSAVHADHRRWFEHAVSDILAGKRLHGASSA